MAEWVKRTQNIQEGDTVVYAYSKAFLQVTGELAGDLLNTRGMVTAL